MNQEATKKQGGADTAKDSFHGIMKAHRRGAAMFDLDRAIEECVRAIRDTGKGGSVTLKLGFSCVNGDPSKVIVTDTITSKKPEPPAEGSLFFTTDDGGLQRDDPAQMDMFKEPGKDESEVAE